MVNALLHICSWKSILISTNCYWSVQPRQQWRWYAASNSVIINDNSCREAPLDCCLQTFICFNYFAEKNLYLKSHLFSKNSMLSTIMLHVCFCTRIRSQTLLRSWAEVFIRSHSLHSLEISRLGNDSADVRMPLSCRPLWHAVVI